MRLIPLSSIIGLLIFMSSPTSYASKFPEKYNVYQGSRLEMRYPDKEYDSIEGIFEEKKVQFYKVYQEPRYDDVISRIQFLELLYLNNEELKGTQQNEYPSSFTDLPENTNQAAIIRDANEKDIVNGYQDGSFGPHDSITRAQMAKILINTYGTTDQTTETAFPDLKQDHDLYAFIQEAVTAGYFNGYPDGLFRPDRSINFSEAETVLARAEQQEVVSIGEQPYWRAYLGLHRLRDPGTTEINILSEKSTQQSSERIPIQVLKRDFPTVSFTLAAQKEKLLDKEYQDTTWTQINTAKAYTADEQLWEGDFIYPTTGTPTLGFGDKLYINGKYSGSHFGHDWANTEGTEIVASNHGFVTLAEWTSSYGNTIVIDHGHNIFTMYLHLSELRTQKGASISKGELIGLMGSTGVSTGSHLHFTHFVGDIIVDSEEWLEKLAN